MPDKHLSTQFDSELNGVSSRVMELGGLVESQIRLAIYALSQFSAESANQVIETEARVNAMEIDIDRELSSIIARRQPTARDLRLLIAISKTTANLERAGDEAEKIARMVKSIIESGAARTLPSSDLRVAAELASGLLRKALDAFARLDTTVAVCAPVTSPFKLPVKLTAALGVPLNWLAGRVPKRLLALVDMMA